MHTLYFTLLRLKHLTGKYMIWTKQLSDEWQVFIHRATISNKTGQFNKLGLGCDRTSATPDDLRCPIRVQTW